MYNHLAEAGNNVCINNHSMDHIVAINIFLQCAYARFQKWIVFYCVFGCAIHNIQTNPVLEFW